MLEQLLLIFKWPRSMASACLDFESTGTIIMGALIRIFNSIRFAVEYASTMFCLAVSAAAALASATAT